MEEDDDFTFPTAAAPAPEEQQDLGELPFHGHLLAGPASPLWHFSCPKTTTQISSTTVEDEASSPSTRSGQVVQLHAVANEERELERAAAEERMDLLWEDFNAKELLRSRVHSMGAAFAAGTDHRAGGPWPGSADGHSSDGESQETSTLTSGRRYGCAPTMLRASSRAGGAGQFFDSSPRCRRSRRTAGWTLLLRLFRRLFTVDETPPSRSRRRGIYVP